jgi:hypothetical protein
MRLGWSLPGSKRFGKSNCTPTSAKIDTRYKNCQKSMHKEKENHKLTLQKHSLKHCPIWALKRYRVVQYYKDPRTRHNK